MHIPFPLPSFIPLYGGLGISGFGLAAIVGTIVGVLVLGRHLRSLSPPAADGISTAAYAALIGGVIGGRAANQLLTRDLVWNDPTTWLHVTGLSLSFTGALVAGAVAALVVLRRRGLPAADALDRLAPPLALALAIGWLGVPVTGSLTTMPWGLAVGPGLLVQPVQIYGALGFAALAGYLWRLRERRDVPGQVVVSLVVLVSAFRLLLGFFETNPVFVGRFSLTQLGDAATLLLGIALAVALQAGAAHRPARSVTDGEDASDMTDATEDDDDHGQSPSPGRAPQPGGETEVSS